MSKSFRLIQIQISNQIQISERPPVDDGDDEDVLLLSGRSFQLIK